MARTIAKRAKGYRLIIEKSTVPVQTGSQLRKNLAQNKNRDFDYDVASNPEFLREGSAVEIFHPDRIVVGVDSPRAEKLLRDIYAPMLEGKAILPGPHRLSRPEGRPLFGYLQFPNSAELIKHASNSFLAMKISFINLIADLCEAAGADVTKVAEGIGWIRVLGPLSYNQGSGLEDSAFRKIYRPL